MRKRLEKLERKLIGRHKEWIVLTGEKDWNGEYIYRFDGEADDPVKEEFKGKEFTQEELNRFLEELEEKYPDYEILVYEIMLVDTNV